MLRYLRIAVTASSLTACALLILLWVRSYRNDFLEGYLIATRSICCRSDEGVVLAMKLGEAYAFMFDPQGNLEIDFAAHHSWSGFLIEWDEFWRVEVPYWCLVALPALCATAPWIPLPTRISRRTLLIATTLVSMGLGAVILPIELWNARN